MRAVVVTDWGGADVLRLQDVPVPKPGSGQVLVDVVVAGVNFRDVFERQIPPYGYGGGYPPFVAGIEGVGRVSSLGPDVDGFSVGDRVGWWLGPGSYAEHVLVDAVHLVQVPEGIDDGTACAALIQGMTAHSLAHSVAELDPDDWVLVHAAAGGVGLLLTQMLALRGVRVIATTSTDEKAELARRAGADVVLAYRDVPDRVTELSGGGVAVVFDAVGRDTFEASLASLRPRGTLAMYGQASGSVPPFDLNRLAERSLFVTKARLPHYTTTREDLLWRASDVFGWIHAGKLSLRIGGRYPLDEAAKAQDDLEHRRTSGKLVLEVR